MGWTGGQYSLYRVALAIAVGCAIASGAQRALLGANASNPVALAVVGSAFLISFVLVVWLAAGYRDRLAAQLLAPFVVFAELAGRASGPVPGALDGILDALAGRTALLPALLLLLHARVPAAPFGAFEARERTDPRGGWLRPAVQTEIGWGLVVMVLAAQLVALWPSGALWRSDAFPSPGVRGIALAAAGFELVLASIGLAARAARPGVWRALAIIGIAWFAAAPAAWSLGQVLLLIFACEPEWWSGRRLATARADGTEAGNLRLPARLFYDGDCGFCHRSVRFILSEELAAPAALRLRFAPLGSETFLAALARHPELDAKSLPDSIVLELEDGVILTRSAAALEIASRLGGFWRLLALAGRLVPKPLLDAGYDGIARVRKRLFAKPKDACPILPPDLRARFDG
jgi:predicted DCC family thiol-disulfide oxidoreductase YuxK